MIDIVITTISDGSFLRKWKEAAARDDVRLRLVLDRKTPASIWKKVVHLQNQGVKVLVHDVDEQDAILRKMGAKEGFIPYDSDNRRNFGYLLSSSADAVISADDDNFPVSATYCTDHSVVTQPPRTRMTLSSSTGWLNPCDLLDTRPAVTWARGFPQFARKSAEFTRTAVEAVEVTINAGLWIGDPDVDAASRVRESPVAYGFDDGTSGTLAPGTWMPINSQNTAIRRQVIAAYYFPRMPDWGDRMADILQGYFAQACARHLGHFVRVGRPLVFHRRNEHDLTRDLEQEKPFQPLLERLLEWLPEARLEGRGYGTTYESLSRAVDETAESFPAREKAYLHQLAEDMRHWLKLCDTIG